MDGEFIRPDQLVYDEDKDCIGSGAFGTVYEAQLLPRGDTVAIKVLGQKAYSKQ